jgi:hypothetical protein
MYGYLVSQQNANLLNRAYVTKYRISANSFRGNYSFLNLALWTVTFGDST